MAFKLVFFIYLDIKNLKDELDLFDNLITQIKDILECRVESVLQEMSVTSLCETPSDPVTIEEFAKIADESSQKAIQSLSRHILLCESAVNEILDTLKNYLRESDKKLLQSGDQEYYECAMKNDNKSRGQKCQECLPCSYFNFMTQYTQRNNDALIQCTKFTFDTIKKRLQQTNKYLGGAVIKEKVKNPMLKADVILAIPVISVKPTLEDMQSSLNKGVQNMLKMSQDLPEWDHCHKIREAQIKVNIFIVEVKLE